MSIYLESYQTNERRIYSIRNNSCRYNSNMYIFLMERMEMTVQDDSDRKVGINVSVPFRHIKSIDERCRLLGISKRSNYIWSLIEKDLGL